MLAVPLTELTEKAEDMAGLLRALSHPARLLIACCLAEGEKGVSDLERMTGVRQPSLSRELAKLREAGHIEARRQSKAVFYRLSDPRVAPLIAALCQVAGPDGPTSAGAGLQLQRREPQASGGARFARVDLPPPEPGAGT